MAMGRKREETDPQRFLLKRGATYYYYRRIPGSVSHMDNRRPFVRSSLQTSDLAKAMVMRDLRERADNEFWASLLIGDDTDAAMKRYQSAITRATALGFTYRSAADLAENESLAELIKRINAAAQTTSSIDHEAILGAAGKPDKPIKSAIKTYFEDIAAADLRFKSADQKRKWKSKRTAAVETFVSLNGNKGMGEITRDDALKVYDFWRKRIAPATGKPTHTASAGNRELSNLRVFYKEWYEHLGERDIRNPFDGLSFLERKERSRPPFSVKWITDTLLKPEALQGLNAEARGVFLAMIETGARLSEICNLTAENIVLDTDVPHIIIRPRLDPNDPREIKTKSSVREIPLVGISLAAIKKHKKGFPRYKDRGSQLSAAINKYLKENELLETQEHSAYSLRHSFEDRMKDAHFDEELRRILMGHSIDRPRYGSGGSLEWKHGELKRIALPFDDSIV